MTEIESVTLQEAQFLVGRSLDEINRVIDRGEVEKRVDLVGSTRGSATSEAMVHKVRKLGQHELVYLALGREVHDSFTPSARKKLYQAIKARPAGADKVSIGPVDVVLKPAITQIRRRYRALRDVHTGIVQRPGAEPVFKGTDVPVHLIAALADGQGIDATLVDYPGLKRKQVTRAIDYARAYPKKGRPYPARSLKRSIADLAVAGVFVRDDDAPALGPDSFR